MPPCLVDANPHKIRLCAGFSLARILCPTSSGSWAAWNETGVGFVGQLADIAEHRRKHLRPRAVMAALLGDCALRTDIANSAGITASLSVFSCLCSPEEKQPNMFRHCSGAIARSKLFSLAVWSIVDPRTVPQLILPQQLSSELASFFPHKGASLMVSHSPGVTFKTESYTSQFELFFGASKGALQIAAVVGGASASPFKEPRNVALLGLELLFNKHPCQYLLCNSEIKRCAEMMAWRCVKLVHFLDGAFGCRP